MESSKPPALDSQEHRNLVGKLVFFTALGVPDSGVFNTALRDIIPLEHRGKASDNAWSSCASCHEDGHSDNVTWIFETGPRQTIPLEGMFTHDVPDVAGRLKDQRALNWSAVRGSNTDFNQNAIGIQGGTGFAKETATGDRSALVFNHGPVFGISDSLDALQEWATTIRAPIVPDLANEQAGRAVFDATARHATVVRSGPRARPPHCSWLRRPWQRPGRRRSRAIRSAPASSSWILRSRVLRASSRSISILQSTDRSCCR